MLHLRIIVPTDRSAVVQEMLSADPAVAHVIVLPGAARTPPGDVVLCDVVREGADEVLETLRTLGVDRAWVPTRWSGTRSSRRPVRRPGSR
ncbi:hypothetical protein [Plantactinospora sp. KLBMP9567]|uniref:hypothetical protein n=1 Tax=Plantactinospora sp. KLBMP9567 TaxID=3085900 RepID=UPI0029825374|nr:hypothetical protein [Plantactinospora sp. KLBMP9567]MDW5329399.1 hypothetical protein [Plantactinospora sp. KLBMP9567]